MMFVERAFVEDCQRKGVLRVLLQSDSTFIVGTPGIDDIDSVAPIVVRDEEVASKLNAELSLATRSVPADWTFSVDDAGFVIRTDSATIPVAARGASLYCLALPTGYAIDEHSVVHADDGTDVSYLVEVDPSGRRQVIIVTWSDRDHRPFSLRTVVRGVADADMSHAVREEVQSTNHGSFDHGRLGGIVGSFATDVFASYLGARLSGG